MENIYKLFVASIVGLLLFSCAGIRTITIQTNEPPQIPLPETVNNILIIDNAWKQPNDMGHTWKQVGKSDAEKVEAKTDSISIIFTEALTQFLSEENYFDKVMIYDKPLRTDRRFWETIGLNPETMNDLRLQTGADAILSLEKLMLQTERNDYFKQEGYPYGAMVGKINSIIRVYMPTMEGKLPAVEFTDSLRWEGFDIHDGKAYADLILPTHEEAMKELALYAAEKMTYVFVPHWETQSRWYYTSNHSLMKEADVFARSNKWPEAISKWKAYYDKTKKNLDKAKAASNIAFAYEMLDDLNSALEWITISKQLFDQSTTNNSLDRKRAELYKNEIQRRKDNYDKSNAMKLN